MSRDSRFPSEIKLRCPAVLPGLIDLAADRHCMTSSEYVRRCVIERLREDGIDTTQIVAMAAA